MLVTASSIALIGLLEGLEQAFETSVHIRYLEILCLIGRQRSNWPKFSYAYVVRNEISAERYFTTVIDKVLELGSTGASSVLGLRVPIGHIGNQIPASSRSLTTAGVLSSRH